jgi:hypothetical protein
MIGPIKWLIAGIIGGLIGAAVWAGISYATNYEVGWIAWGIGFLVGVCVRISAGENEEGFAPGAVAAVIAVGAVLLGKYAAVSLLVSSFSISADELNFTAEDMIVSFADDIVEQRTSRGQSVVFPNGMTVETASTQADYPADVWQEAAAKWAAIPAAEQQQQIAQRTKAMQAIVGGLAGNVRGDAFANSFGLFDALWFFLAAVTAFKIGHGNIASDDDERGRFRSSTCTICG